MQQYAIIDIETTGGNLELERITEIACYIFDGEKIIDRFATLINPEKPIPPFIINLTGITDEMVQSAPRFYEIAEQLVRITEGKIFVAHNSQFDYKFIRREFSNLGFNFERDTLCTCKFSKKVLPGHSSYSLGNLCRDLGIINISAHRAESDVKATVALFDFLLKNCKPEHLLLAVKPFTETDPGEFLNSELIKKLPEKTGVYYFLDKEKNIIYIGKSKNIRKRVIGHFKRKSAGKTERMRRLVDDIQFELTGNELVALLLESGEIKTHQPLFNRSQKQKDFRYGVFDSFDNNGYSRFYIDKIQNQHDAIALFKSYDEAERILYRKLKQFQLCPALCGLEKTKGEFCFNFQLKECFGACGGLENKTDYNLRAEKAIGTFKYDYPAFIIIDKGRTYDEKSVLLIENGKFQGFGFFDVSEGWSDINQLKNNLKLQEETPDIQNIILSRIKSKKYEKLLLLKDNLIHEKVVN